MATCSDTKTNIEQFVCRITPANCQFIKVSLVPKAESNDFFKLHTHKSSNGTILLIKGSSSSAVVRGLSYYLRVYCNTTYTEFGLSRQSFNIVHLNGTIHHDLNNLTLFYGNICAFSYSYWAWNWDMWKKHVDWIVYRGFTIVLLPTGIESVNLETFKMLGLNEDEILDFFNGPAYLAWSRMGNMKNFTAPLTLQFIKNQVSLHKKISKRFNELGVKVVIPGFSGFVPYALTKLFNETYFNTVSCWNGFNKTYSCLTQTDPTKQLYGIIGSIYMKFLLRTFQTNHIYAVDMFNENTPKNSSLQYLQSCGKNTVSVIKSADPHGVWLLQGWTFGYDQFWVNDRVAAYLQQVMNNDIIILDMFAEVNPTWNRTKSFFGKPFIWTMVNNFGGNTLINGNIKSTLDGFNHALNVSKSLIGFGFMPEGIHENTILLDAIMQFTTFYNINQIPFEPSAFYEEWKGRISNYRYSGYRGSAVMHVVEKLYTGKSKGSFPDSCFIYQHPGFEMPFYPNSNIADNLEILQEYLEIILQKQVQEFSEIFVYDLSSVAQSYGEQVFHEEYVQLVSAYRKKDINLLKISSQIMIKIINLLDEIFSLIPLRSLPCYQDGVKSFALIVKENPVKLVHDLRLQLTTWGYNNEVLDYAFKMWSGMLNNYYKPRWTVFFDYLWLSLFENMPFDQEAYEVRILEVERSFVMEGTSSSCVPWDEQNASELAQLVEKLIFLRKQ